MVQEFPTTLILFKLRMKCFNKILLLLILYVNLDNWKILEIHITTTNQDNNKTINIFYGKIQFLKINGINYFN